MAQSQVEIFNLALTELGQDRVTSPTDDVETARTLNANWTFVRDAVMAEHPWKFAIKRTTLPALAEVPIGFALQYQLPEECLKLVQVGTDWVFYTSELETFALEGGRVLTDVAAPLDVRYVQRVTNVGLWPVLFSTAVAYRLASVCGKKLTKSDTTVERIRGEYEITIRKAKRHNAIERPPQRQLDGSWLDARGD